MACYSLGTFRLSTHYAAEDHTVTIRHRDSRTQERVQISQLRGILEEACSFKRIFEQL